MACTYRAKFVEVSVGINHNVDELLAGALTQIRLKKEHCELQVIIEFSAREILQLWEGEGVGEDAMKGKIYRSEVHVHFVL